MENGDYLLLGQDRNENIREITRHSRHDADAYDAFEHDVNKVLQAIKPLLDEVPPNIFSDDPEEVIALAAIGSRFRQLEPKVVHDAVRLLTGSAADFLDDYFESDILKGYLASSAIIGTKVGPYSQGSGLVLLYHFIGEHDGVFGAWAFHKKGNGGFTHVLARAAESFGAEICLEAPVARVRTRDGRAIGVELADGSDYEADVVVSAVDPRRTFLELVDPRELPTDRARRFAGFASRARRPRSTSRWMMRRVTRLSAIERTSTAGSPTSGRRWSTSSARSTTPSTAGTRSGRTWTARSSRRSTRTWHRPAST
jgi:phytoene dehydrogenase-like protein